MSRFQFRKRKKLIPGLYLNISKKGLGLSAGPKGAKISRSATGQVSGSIGIPGTGVSYRKKFKAKKNEPESQSLTDEVGLSHNIKDKAAYISLHGNVLTSAEIGKALFYLGFFFLASLSILLTYTNSNIQNLAVVLWLLSAFLYFRESKRNKQKWRERTTAHLASCEHIGKKEVNSEIREDFSENGPS